MKRVWLMSSILVIAAVLGAAGKALAVQARPQAGGKDPNAVFDPALFQALKYRLIGPFRGGRSTAVAGVPSQRNTFYMGATGGGVWKTTNGGESWQNVSDAYFKAASIGAIAVSESDPNVVYVGTGSACIRGNVSPGVGIYKSTDAGQSWKHVGLEDAGQIGRIRIHPQNPDLVYAAVLGHAFGPNAQRGVFRSKDGGKTWEKVLFVSDRAGAVDLALDATNPRILYASVWRAERKPWTMISGGDEGGLYKTTDGGDNWEKLAGGLPGGVVGKIGVAVSPANPNRVWALVEAEAGGVYRSDDAGKSFRLINAQRPLQDRAWYYIHIFADPQDENTVYVANTGFYKSVDGGVTYEAIPDPHGDNHDLWINPRDPQVMINSNDGGANVTFNGGKTWSTQLNQPTAEIYRLTVDDQYPYRVYGPQQDNSTISLPSRITASRYVDGPISTAEIHLQHWTAVGGCETGDVAVDPRNPNVVYAGCYGGMLTRVDKETEDLRIIMPYPQLAMGQAAQDLKYRFQWQAPVRLSPHNPDILYHASQFVHVSSDGGQSWRLLGPDLTRNDKEKQELAGGPIQYENAGVEVYGTIFAFEESRQTPGLLWAGSDDGLVHISRDGGKSWEDITPKGIPEWATVNDIELSSHDPGRAFLAVHNYRMDDFKPYVFRTNDHGKSWELLTNGRNGIPATHFVRVVREDPDRKGLLYAGTEFGMYVSFDDGSRWQSLQLNLPVTPITDLAVHQKDLVVATQGRSFWILDDLTPLHQLTERVAQANAHLFKARDAYRVAVETGVARHYSPGFRSAGGATLDSGRVGENAPAGAMIFYSFAKPSASPLTLEILDESGRVIRTFSSESGGAATAVVGGDLVGVVRKDAGASLSKKAGLNLFVWDLRSPGPDLLEGATLWAATTTGPRAVPGSYQARLKAGEWTQTQTFRVLAHPGLKTTQADYQDQFDLLVQIRDTISETHNTILRIREIRDQATELAARMKKLGHDEVVKAADSLGEKLTEVEHELIQTKGGTPIILPARLDNQFIYLYGVVANADARPTSGSYDRFKDLRTELGRQLARLQQVIDTDLASFDGLVRAKGIGPVIVGQPKL